MAEIGKRVGTKHYVACDQLEALPPQIRELVLQGEALLPHAEVVANINVVRIDQASQEVCFLSYPDLGLKPFPSLKSSWRVNVAAKLVLNRRYDGSLNPPILHRTELLLRADHPARPLCETLTRDCESLGLFSDSTRIGFQQQWDELIRSRGFRLDGFGVVPIGNEEEGEAPSESDETVSRHLTALSRNTLSAPVQRLISDSLLTTSCTFFDYGCGRGNDLATLESNGFSVAGWDPHYRVDAERIPADVVNLGFVINVIEDKAERCAALEGAFSLARQVLAVSAMLGSNDTNKGREFRDGVLTSRRTFQKYYSQTELRHYIESVLDAEAYPTAPGVFYVFKDRNLEQRFLLARTSNRARTQQIILRFPRPPRAVSASPVVSNGARRRSRPDSAPREELIAEVILGKLEVLWRCALDLGREPTLDECSEWPALISFFETPKRVWRACLERNDPSALEDSGRGRREDILVMLSLRAFDRRRQFDRLEPRLARDIKVFFGTMTIVEAEAKKLLFSLQDTSVIDAACQSAATNGLGWLEAGESLQLHTSLINRLPAALRVYIGCAAIMVGDLTGYDLVKAHIRSGKVSLLAYDDFEGKPYPLLQRRAKVRLRDQELDLYEYGERFAPTVLFHKSRYINEEFPHYADQQEIEEQLESLALFDLNAYGPAYATFETLLDERRYSVKGFSLVRSSDIPDLDHPCGNHFRYRDFIECGETWQRDKIDNVPQAAATYNALRDLCAEVLDPVIDYFGAIELTYGFASSSLTKQISSGIAPELDQHASYEHNRRGNAICDRGGAAVDFVVRDEDMFQVAKWISTHCRFDRIYVYGPNRPIHVSIGPENKRSIVRIELHHGKRVPRAVKAESL